MSEKYVVRRTTDSEYQFERPDGSILVGPVDASAIDALPTDADEQPTIPADIAEPVISYAEANDALHEWRVIQWIGIRYVDDR